MDVSNIFINISVYALKSLELLVLLAPREQGTIQHSAGHIGGFQLKLN